MKYRANPVLVDALRITWVGGAHDNGMRVLELEDGHSFEASAAQLARIDPKPGDYVVTQEDGYVYLNPKDVFERKYTPEGAE